MIYRLNGLTYTASIKEAANSVAVSFDLLSKQILLLRCRGVSHRFSSLLPLLCRRLAVWQPTRITIECHGTIEPPVLMLGSVLNVCGVRAHPIAHSGPRHVEEAGLQR